MDGIVKKENIQNISDAIKSKNRYPFKYTTEQMPSAITSIPTCNIESNIDDLVLKTVVSLCNLNATQVRAYGMASCSNLQSVDLPNATAIKQGAFSACPALTQVILPAVTELEPYAFRECTAIEHLIFPSVTEVYSDCFYKCTNLKKIDFNSQVTFAGSTIFSMCSSLTALILRYDGLCPITNTRAFSSAQSIPLLSGKGYVYVPNAQLTKYKNDVYWKMFSLSFRAIENYPSICG